MVSGDYLRFGGIRRNEVFRISTENVEISIVLEVNDVLPASAARDTALYLLFADRLMLVDAHLVVAELPAHRGHDVDDLDAFANFVIGLDQYRLERGRLQRLARAVDDLPLKAVDIDLDVLRLGEKALSDDLVDNDRSAALL